MTKFDYKAGDYVLVPDRHWIPKGLYMVIEDIYGHTSPGMIVVVTATLERSSHLMPQWELAVDDPTVMKLTGEDLALAMVLYNVQIKKFEAD